MKIKSDVRAGLKCSAGFVPVTIEICEYDYAGTVGW
jgi:hypothetical protein